MKYALLILAVVAIFASPVLAADNGNVSQNALAQMGLSSMAVQTDAQGTEVRGMGFALAWGNSFAKQGGLFGGAGSTNGYFAAGNYVAAGTNNSYAGSNCLFGCTVFAGGGSAAFAY